MHFRSTSIVGVLKQLLDDGEATIFERVTALAQVLFDLSDDSHRRRYETFVSHRCPTPYTVAQGLLAALGDISRFPDGDHAAAFLGLAPLTRQSGNHCYHGPITKAGQGHARWLLVQAAQRLDCNPGPLGAFFRRLARKKNRNVAVVAAARKLVTIAFLMLTRNEPYRYALPVATNAKLSRIRFQTTRTRRSFPKANRTAARPTVPTLADVCAKEELPPATTVDDLPPGERQMLRRKGLTDAVRKIQAGRSRATSVRKRTPSKAK